MPKEYKFNGKNWPTILKDFEDVKPIYAGLLNTYKTLMAIIPNIRRIKNTILKKVNHLFPPSYDEECNVLAKYLKLSPTMVKIANLNYELCNIGLYYERISPKLVWGTIPSILGCTSIILQNMDGKMEHHRNLDWDNEKLRHNTVILRHKDIVTVGFPGFIGVVSGMRPGAFSITLNQVPHNVGILKLPVNGLPPTIVIRNCLTNCQTFQEAVKYLLYTPVITSCIYTVCGIKGGCIIETTPLKTAIIHMMPKVPLVATNHYQTKDLEKINKAWDKETLSDSFERHEAATLQAYKANKLKNAGKAALMITTNYLTLHQITFSPEDGEYDVLEISKEK